MKGTKIVLVILVAVALLSAPAFAQMWGQQSGSETAQAGRESSPAMNVSGKITSIDLVNGTLTLDNGTHFLLAPSLQYTSTPVIGQDVQVTYIEENGNKVARSVEVDGGAQ